MPRRVNPIILLGLVIVLFFSSLISAIAQIGPSTGGSTAGASGGLGSSAVGLALGKQGALHVEGAEGPDAFSCTGLLRWVGRNLGFDGLPWAPSGWYAYPQRNGAALAGDVIILPGAAGVGLALGDGRMVMSNAATGVVGIYDQGVMGGTVVIPPWNGGDSTVPATDPTVPATNSTIPATDPTIPATNSTIPATNF
jgi:hypothetical protein